MKHTFEFNPELPFINPEWKGNKITGKRFHDFNEGTVPPFKKVLKYLFSRNKQAKQKRNDSFRLKVQKDDLANPSDWICWLGHASFLIQINGIRLLIDPVFGTIGYLKRRVKVPYAVDDFGQIDYLLVSHDHRDHCDKSTIKSFRSRVDRVICPLRLDKLIGKWLPKASISTVGWYQKYTSEDEQVRITFMPTQHWGRRYLHDKNYHLWGSYLIQIGNYTIWFGGDSGYSPHFELMNKYFPKIDLALIGIGAYAPGWMMEAAHTNPEQVWQGFEECRAKKLLPMHFATYDLSREPFSEPRNRIISAAQRAGRFSDLLLPAVGECVSLFSLN